MENLFTYSLGIFMAFFAVMNPFANAVVFLGLTEGQTSISKRNTAKTSVITAFCIVLCFILGGKYIFELFNITVTAFKVAGGLLLFYIGFEMLMSKKSSIKNTRSKSEENIAITPLGIPILAGPGTIVTVMNYTINSSILHIFILTAIFALLIFITYFFFIISDKMVEKMNPSLIAVIGKLMGLILTIMGTQMVIQGVKLAFNI